MRGGHQPSMGGSSAKYGGGHKPSMGGSSTNYGGAINKLWGGPSAKYGGAINQLWWGHQPSMGGGGIFPPVCTGSQNPQNYFSNTYVLPSVNRTAGPIIGIETYRTKNDTKYALVVHCNCVIVDIAVFAISSRRLFPHIIFEICENLSHL